MKIIQTYRTDKYDERSWLEISIDDKPAFRIGSGEPEDMTLGRDLNDAYKVIDMMLKAYDAGKREEKMDIIYKEVKGWD